MRPAPPTYPRPVPEIVFDDDVFSLGSEIPTNDVDAESAEAAAERRAAKRRRIEDAAHAYLRGEQLFILSAGLKGPFNKNWQNPWAKRKSVATEKSAAPDKTHGQRLSEQNRPALPPSRPQPSPKPEGKLIQSVDVVNPFQPIEPIQAGTSPAQRVEDWLRTSHAYAAKQHTSPPSSPTPRTSAVDKEKPNTTTWSATPPVRLPPTSSQVPPAPLVPAPSKAFELSQATTTDGLEVINAADAHSRLQSVLQMNSVSPALASHLPPRSSCPAILTKSNKSAHTENLNPDLEPSTLQLAPFSTDPMSMTERRILRSARKSHNIPTNSNHDGQLDLGSSARPTSSQVRTRNQTTKNIDKALQSTSASGVASIEAFPSAQQRSNLPALVSDPSESEQPLPDFVVQPPTRNTMKSIEADSRKNDAGAVSAENNAEQVHPELDKQNEDVIDMRPSNADDGNAAIESLEMLDNSQAVFVTPLLNHCSPESRPKEGKGIKRASFAASINIERHATRPLASSSSLKSVLKTSKPSSAPLPQNPKSPQESLDASLHTADAAPKSILKRTSTVASTSALSANKQQSTIQSGQNGGRLSITGLDDFDLEAAVDDLGSFLSTWDDEIGGSQMGLAKA